MRPVSGFDRPVIQWTFVLCGLVLIGLCGWTGTALRRSRATIEALRAENREGSVQRERLEADAARERAAREAFALQLGRERSLAAPVTMPTLTLTPLLSPSPRGPDTAVPSTTAPVIELRLMLPPRAATTGPFEIRLRSWNGGDPLWIRGGLRASTVEGRQAIVARVASDVFTAGPYEITLSAKGNPPSDVATYEVSFVPSSKNATSLR